MALEKGGGGLVTSRAAYLQLNLNLKQEVEFGGVIVWLHIISSFVMHKVSLDHIDEKDRFSIFNTFTSSDNLRESGKHPQCCLIFST